MLLFLPCWWCQISGDHRYFLLVCTLRAHFLHAPAVVTVKSSLSTLQDFQEQQDGTAQIREGQKVLCNKLEKLIAVEDPYNGETVVRIISKGFDSSSAQDLSDNWKI